MNAATLPVRPIEASPTVDRAGFQRVRAMTLELAQPLSSEDQLIQSMPDASPTKWHLAHTTWFFETFVLRAGLPDYRTFPGEWDALFNSYYHSVGPLYPRAARGLISRPGLAEVHAYRQHVDAALGTALDAGRLAAAALDIVELGLHHEQQHQELLLTDIQHALGCNPLHPAYRPISPSAALARAGQSAASASASPLGFTRFSGGSVQIGAAAEHGRSSGFHFDNETPRHSVFADAFALANRPVTNAEFRAFIEAGGYRDPLLWLSDGWHEVQRAGWQHPLYWNADCDAAFSLEGELELDLQAPVSHISVYEADAFARWADARLPTEIEWEIAAGLQPVAGNFLESGALRPLPAARTDEPGVGQLHGDVWEWTQSAYAPYPGFRPASGALGEYNGKFMINQLVLRGGSCFSPQGHLRPTYRNFFPPATRWQVSGIRLAKDAT